MTRVAVVGATGLVGRELIALLRKRRFPVGRLSTFNTRKPPTLAALREADLVFMVSSDAVSKRFAPALARAGKWVIDDSSAFRLDPNVPLVLPEVNASALSREKRLIAGPNCTLTGAAVAGHPLVRSAGAKAIRVASYQSVSGAGKAAMAELRAQLRGSRRVAALPRTIAFNLFPQVGSFDGEGHSTEENKVAAELRKIWGLPGLPVSVTAVRVPVLRGHSLAIWLETRRPLSPVRARGLLRRAAGVRLWREGDYPTPRGAAGTWPVHVARLRRGAAKNELCLWTVSDNLLKGAALNSVQIAEELLRRGWL